MEIPERMKSRPQDKRGYPIPYVTWIRPDGKPDFAVLDPMKCEKAHRLRYCGICGNRMDGNVFFIGGPMCEVNGLFADPAMHRECAEFSIQTCPHMVLPKAKYAVRKEKSGTMRMVSVSDVKASRFGLFEAKDYQPVIHGGELLVRVEKPWISIVWYRDGKLIQDDEIGLAGTG